MAEYSRHQDRPIRSVTQGSAKGQTVPSEGAVTVGGFKDGIVAPRHSQTTCEGRTSFSAEVSPWGEAQMDFTKRHDTVGPGGLDGHRFLEWRFAKSIRLRKGPITFIHAGPIRPSGASGKVRKRSRQGRKTGLGEENCLVASNASENTRVVLQDALIVKVQRSRGALQ